MSVVLDEPQAKIERAHMRIARRNTYIACEELDMTWDLKEVKKFEEAWQHGYPIDMIADAMGRDVDEVAILAMDRARKGMIGPRENGVWGGKSEKHEVKLTHKLSTGQKEAVIELLRDGVNNALLSRAMNVTPSTVYYFNKIVKKNARPVDATESNTWE